MEQWVKNALKKLLDDNSETLVSGLSIQGMDWPEPTMTKEMITQAVGVKPMIVIDIPRYSISEFWTGANKSRTGDQDDAKVFYDVELELFWGALPKKGEDQQFEGMGADWDTFTDRVVRTIWTTISFWDSTSSHQFRLADGPDPRSHRRIRSIVNDTPALASSEGRAIWYKRIAFELEQCIVALDSI